MIFQAADFPVEPEGEGQRRAQGKAYAPQCPAGISSQAPAKTQNGSRPETAWHQLRYSDGPEQVATFSEPQFPQLYREDVGGSTFLESNQAVFIRSLKNFIPFDLYL